MIYFIINISTTTVYPQTALNVGFVSVTTDYKNIHVIVLKTDAMNVTQYTFYRADENSNDYKEIAKTATNYFTDESVDPNKQAYCYRVSYVREDGVKSEMSEPFCSIFLSSTNKKSIEWTPFLKLPNAGPVEYFIDLINIDGSINRTNSYSTTKLSANISEITGVKKEIEDFDYALVRIKAIQPTTFYYNNQILTNYPIEIYSNSFLITPPLTIYVPTAFTPDGDGNNEIFIAKGRNIVEFKMTIFNKWGDVVFESFDINTGWDGTQLDRITPSLMGNYAYRITAKNKFDNIFDKIGTVLLLK